MAAVSATADVQAVRVHGNRSVSSSNHCSSESLRLSLFPTPASSDHDPEKRATKRRKLESGKGESVKTSDVFDTKESVLIARVALDLVILISH